MDTKLFIDFVAAKTQQNNKTLQAFLEMVPEAVIIFDKQFRYSFVNARALEILQTKRENLIGRAYKEFFGSSNGSLLLPQMREAMKTQKSFTKKYYSRVLNTHLEGHFYPSDHELTLFLKDVGMEKRTQDNLKKSEENFLRLIDANIVGVAVEDTSGRVLYANQVFLSMVGYTLSDVQQNRLNWREITPKKYRKLDAQQEKLLFENGSIKPYEKEYYRKDGSLVPILKGGVLLSKSNKTSVIFTIDITDRKEVEKRKDDFISIVSHELKTPITSIKGFTQLLISRSKQNKDAKMLEYLERMHTQINRLTYLVNDILDVRKIQQGKLILNREFFDINGLVQEVIHEVRTASPHNVLEIQTGPELIVFADYYRIYQAILNLITNAVKYSHEMGPIHVSISRAGRHAEVTVEDQGIGISADNQKRIFDKFFRIKNGRFDYPGLGLGLYITADIIARHKGQIWVESPTRVKANNNGSSREYGSAFHCKLPLARQHAK